MSNIELGWLDEKQTVFVYTFGKKWEWHEYHKAVQDAWNMIDLVNHEVDVLMDLTENVQLPSGAIGQVKKALSTPRNPNVRRTVIAGVNPFIARIGDVVQKITSNVNWDYTTVVTLEEAYKKLGVQEPTK